MTDRYIQEVNCSKSEIVPHKKGILKAGKRVRWQATVETGRQASSSLEASGTHDAPDAKQPRQPASQPASRSCKTLSADIRAEALIQ